MLANVQGIYHALHAVGRYDDQKQTMHAFSEYSHSLLKIKYFLELLLSTIYSFIIVTNTMGSSNLLLEELLLLANLIDDMCYLF